LTAWYEDAFGRDYLTLYLHRNDEEANRDVADIVRLIDPPRNEALLDLCCGAGRHLVAFRRAGFSHLTGLDLSEDLLAEARSRLDSESMSDIRLIQSDMRDIPTSEAFRTIVSLFTSFGYFPSTEEDARVLCSAQRALLPGGTFLLDTLNRQRVISQLVPEEASSVGAMRIAVRRRITEDGLRVEKRTLVTQPGAPETVYHESVRMYTKPEIESMLDAAGLTSPRFYGALDGRDYSETAPRMVFTAHKGNA
jgi:ubiquinone/menaquinone biosynthesis C-methylase UbiE